jgi:hypothetical protein
MPRRASKPLAEPGAVCLSRAAYEQGCGNVEASFADLGERALKNIAKPIHVYAGAAPGRAPTAQDRLVGAPRPSLVILPCANLGDPAQDYFVDGITDTLTTHEPRFARSRASWGRSARFAPARRGDASRVFGPASRRRKSSMSQRPARPGARAGSWKRWSDRAKGARSLNVEPLQPDMG